MSTPHRRLTVALLTTALLPGAWLGGARRACAETFVDAGLNASRVSAKIALIDERQRESSSGWHLGIGARRRVGVGHDFGVRLEIDDVDSKRLLAVRALDYRRHVSERLALNFFAGAARLDLATPAYGYYLGLGVQLKALTPRLDLGLDLRVGDELARDNLLPSDPQGGSPDNFYSLSGTSLYLSYRF